MNTQNPQLDRLEALLKLANGSYVKPEELKALVEGFTEIIKNMREHVAGVSHAADLLLEQKINDLSDMVQNTFKDINKTVAGIPRTDLVKHRKDIMKIVDDKISAVKDMIPVMPEFPDMVPLKKQIKEHAKALQAIPKNIATSDDIDEVIHQIDGKIKNIDIHPSQGPMLHPTSIGNLPDVNTVGIAVGQTLVWNGTYFAPGSSSGGGYTKATPTGSVDSSNTVYGVTNAPVYVVSDAGTFFDGHGYVYNSGASTITMDNPPTQFIFYFY